MFALALACSPALADAAPLVLLFAKRCADCTPGRAWSQSGRVVGAARLVALVRRREGYLAIGSWRASYGRNEGPKLFEGDQRTPEGVYHLVALHDHAGDDNYGDLSLLTDYPNPDDVRRGSTGSSISIHGGKPRPTLGCIRLLDGDDPSEPPWVSRDSIHELAALVAPSAAPVPLISVAEAAPACLPEAGHWTSPDCASMLDLVLLSNTPPPRETVSLLLRTRIEPADDGALGAWGARAHMAPAALREPTVTNHQINRAASETMTATASSSAAHCAVDGRTHQSCAPLLAIDGRDDTAWCEGAPDDGVGAWLQLRLPRSRHIARVEIKTGYWKGGAGSSTWFHNGRARELRITIGEHATDCAVDERDPAMLICPTDNAAGDTVRLEIRRATAGAPKSDTCLSEVRIVAIPEAE
jgi:hypothetical protein